jgi:hypothetical protein
MSQRGDPAAFNNEGRNIFNGLSQQVGPAGFNKEEFRATAARKETPREDIFSAGVILRVRRDSLSVGIKTPSSE